MITNVVINQAGSYYIITSAYLLNQARAWFLKIDPVRIVGMCVCVCVSAPEATNN